MLPNLLHEVLNCTSVAVVPVLGRMRAIPMQVFAQRGECLKGAGVDPSPARLTRSCIQERWRVRKHACEPPRLPKNEEIGIVPSDEENDEERCQWKIKVCPIGTCSPTSLKNANLWSYQSEFMCRQYLARHLHYSTAKQHELDKISAWELAKSVEVAVVTETREHREQYKASIRKQQEEKEAWDAKGKSKGKGKGKVNDARANWDNDASGNWDDIQENPGSRSDGLPDDNVGIKLLGSINSQIAKRKRLPENEVVGVPLSKLKIIKDTMERTDHGLQSAIGTLVDAAKRLHADQQGLHVCLFCPLATLPNSTYTQNYYTDAQLLYYRQTLGYYTGAQLYCYDAQLPCRRPATIQTQVSV